MASFISSSNLRTGSLPIKDQQPQPQQQQQGELALYLDGRLAHRSPGKTKTGAAQVSAAAGSLAVGARQEAQGYGACWQGAVASLAILGRRLDAKAVAALFAAPLLRGSEEHLRVYFDFDFEAPEGTSSFIREGGEVMNRGRGRGSGGGAAGVLHGAARLVLLRSSWSCPSCLVAAGGAPLPRRDAPLTRAMPRLQAATSFRCARPGVLPRRARPPPPPSTRSAAPLTPSAWPSRTRRPRPAPT